MNKKDVIQDAVLEKIENCPNDPITGKKRACVVLGTGVGKSYLVLKQMVKNYHEFATFLIVIPRASLKKNWIDEMIKHGLSYLIPHVHFINYRSFTKVENKFDWVFFDEVHNLNKTHMYVHLNCEMTNTNWFGLTATMFPEGSADRAVFDDHFTIVHTFTTAHAVEEKLLNDYRILIHRIPLSSSYRMRVLWHDALPEDQCIKHLTTAIHNSEKNKKYQVLNQQRIQRSKFLQTTRTKTNYAKALSKAIKTKTLIFAESTSIADEICQHSFHSKNTPRLNEINLTKFKNGEIMQLSAVGQLNEGVNIPNLENVIVMHTYNSFSKLEQRIGRALRLEVDQTAYVHILVHHETVDMEWMRNALANFNKEKIGYVKPEKVNEILSIINHDKRLS